MRRSILPLLAALVLGLWGVEPAEAASITTTLGTPGTGLSDGDQLSIGGFNTSQVAGQPAPFGVFAGFDTDDGPSYAESWTFAYAPFASVAAASITLGIYDHDSAATGDQVASFTVDGVDLRRPG